MIVERELLEEIKPFLDRKEFLAITGARQTGKTTFLEIIRGYLVERKQIDKTCIHIVTFEDRKLLWEFESDPVSFVNSFKTSKGKKTIYLMIDEFQYVEDGGQKLKLIYDTVKDIKIIITGSSSLEIKANVGRYMVGRLLTFPMGPFNFGEILSARNERLEKLYRERNKMFRGWLREQNRVKIKRGEDVFFREMIRIYEELCIWGGYPAVVLSKMKRERAKVLNDIYSNYILKDIKGLLELATEKNLFLLSQYLATQIGNIIVYQNISERSGLNYRQLKQHLNILKETFICEELKPFFKNRQKELSKNPKIYFLDTGFRNSLMDNMNNLAKRSDGGALVENVVFLKLKETIKDGGKIFFWRTKAGAEVDFVLQINGELIPVEVKYSKFDKAKVTKSFTSFIDRFRPRYGIVLTKNYFEIAGKNKTEILFMPVYYL